VACKGDNWGRYRKKSELVFTDIVLAAVSLHKRMIGLYCGQYGSRPTGAIAIQIEAEAPEV
jgi:hypothetical protein